MQTVYDWLHSQTTSDVMTREMVVLHPSNRLSDAVSLFIHEEISGAPVIDEDGLCVGVLTVTDIATAYAKGQNPLRSTHSRQETFATADPGMQRWRELAELSHVSESQSNAGIGRFMTRDVVSVSEYTPLADIIRFMIDAHLHRVLILGEDKRLLGVVTTTDIMAAILRAGASPDDAT